MAATNLGQLSVDIIANIGNLQKGLASAAQLINRFTQQTAKQVQTGTKFMGSQYDKFAVGVQKTAQTAQKTQTPLIDAINQTTKAVQNGTKVLSKSFATMKSGGKTIDKTRNQFKALGGGLDSIGQRMSNFIRFNIAWFATWRLMWAVLGAIKAGVAAIVEFDTAITNLGAVTGATQEQLLKLEDTAREVGATTRFTAVETATAMVDLSKAGFSVSEVNAMIAGTAQLAIGTLSELTEATQLVATTLRTFSLQAADATMVANIFAAAITNSRLTIDSLRNSMKYIGPIMAEIGYSLEDTAAVLGVLSDRGLEAGISARGLRGFFSALIAPSVKLRKELERVGLSIHDVSPLSNDLATILFRLREAGFDVESAMRGLERRVGTIAIALVSAGEYFDVLKDAITATTAAEVISERQTGSLGYQIKLIKSAATEVALSFKDLFLPAIKGLMSGVVLLLQSLGALLSMLNELLNILPPTIRQIVILVGVIGLLVKVLGPAALLGVLIKVKAALVSLLVFIGPVGWAILAVIGAVTAYTIWIKKAGEATTKARKEIAGQVFDLNKQRTELARTAIALEEYKDDQIKLRTALEGLADIYPEIRTLLMNENVTYEDAIEVVDKLIESKTEEARVRKEELIVAIDAEIEAHKREIESIEKLAQRIEDAFPVWKQLLQLWHLIRFGTLDSTKATREAEDAIRELERTRRQLMPTVKKAGEQEIFYAERISMLAKDRLEMAKKQGKTAKELLPLYDEVIKAQREEAVSAELAVKTQLEALMKREQAQISLADAILDEEGEVKKAYDDWIKLEKELASLQMERGEIISDYYKTLEDLKKAEDELFSLQVKRRMTEEQWNNRVIYFAQIKMVLLKQAAEQEGKWTEENAKEYIDAQKTAFETFTKLLDLRLQASLSAGLREEQATEAQQIEFEKWYPLFNNFAKNYYEMTQDIKQYDEKLAEKIKKDMGTLGIAFEEVIVLGGRQRELFLEAEYKRIKKAYQEYNLAMLEFDISVGRERREVLIKSMEARLADTEYWDGKEFTAKLAFEKTIVSLYQTTNKEIIAEAKETAKTNIALGLETLAKRREYLKQEAAGYPILTEEITDAIKDLMPDVSKIIEDTQEKMLEATADTVDEVVALATKEYEEKKQKLEEYLEALKLMEAEGIDVSKERTEAIEAINQLEFLGNKAHMEKLIELRRAYVDDYISISEGALAKINISSKESYEIALADEKKRYADAGRVLAEAFEKNVMSYEYSQVLIELATKTHTENKKKIEIGYYEFLSELLVQEGLKQGKFNEEIEAELWNLWLNHFKNLYDNYQDAIEALNKLWPLLVEKFKLTAETIEGRWDNLATRLVNRIKEAIKKSKGYLSDWALFAVEIFDFALNKIASAFAELFQYIMEGGSRALELSRDQTLERLSTIERALEAEAQAHGKFTDKYKELLDAQGEAQKELADNEFELLKEKTAWWRNFINSVIAEVGRLIAYLLAKAIVIKVLQWLGIPTGGFAKGGEIKVPGNIPEFKKGGLIPSLRKQLQSYQKGGEVIIRAHEGEFMIPEPLVKQIKRTREVPETLTSAIVAGKPPSFQRGGEIANVGTAGSNLIVNFQPGTDFTEVEKVKARQYFEKTWLPLWREAQRRE